MSGYIIINLKTLNIKCQLKAQTLPTSTINLTGTHETPIPKIQNKNLVTQCKARKFNKPCEEQVTQNLCTCSTIVE